MPLIAVLAALLIAAALAAAPGAALGAPSAQTPPADAALKLDATPRTAVITAFPPEIVALGQRVEHARTIDVGAARFVLGEIAGRPVILFLSGVSMVNAAMSTEKAIQRFNVKRIVFSGVAGGADPDLGVGDVVAPGRWAEYLETVMARETSPGVFQPPADEPLAGGHLGMIYPKETAVPMTGGATVRRVWFDADPALLALARTLVPKVKLAACTAEGLCLRAQPRLVVGGAGVSGPAFVDNAALRGFLNAQFGAKVIDMESAAVAHVALSEGVPFIAFRSLSDLAGGDPGKNQGSVFFRFAADNSAAVVGAFLEALPD